MGGFCTGSENKVHFNLPALLRVTWQLQLLIQTFIEYSHTTVNFSSNRCHTRTNKSAVKHEPFLLMISGGCACGRLIVICGSAGLILAK